jgi:hypothetical protein
MSTINKGLIEINAGSMESAQKSIIDMVNSRSLVLTGKLDLSVPMSFPSKNREKEIKKRLERVISYPTMKRVSMFLRMYAQLSGTEHVKVDYSAKEKKIQELRKVYVEARKKAIEAYASYKEEKGDFYKSAPRG